MSWLKCRCQWMWYPCYLHLKSGVREQQTAPEVPAACPLRQGDLTLGANQSNSAKSHLQNKANQPGGGCFRVHGFHQFMCLLWSSYVCCPFFCPPQLLWSCFGIKIQEFWKYYRKYWYLTEFWIRMDLCPIVMCFLWIFTLLGSSAGIF